MGQGFSVDTEALNKAVGQLRDYSDTYTNIAKQLMDRARTMGSAWDSPDNAAYVKQIEGLTDDLKAMADKLLTCAQALEEQSGNYSGHVENNIGIIKKLTN